MGRGLWIGMWLAAAHLVFQVSPAAAQACRGTPPFGREGRADTGFEAALIFPEEGTGFSGEFKWAPVWNLAVNFRGAFVSDVGAGADVWQLGADGAYRFYAGTDDEFPLDVCFLSGFLFHFFSDLPTGVDQSGFILPIGASFGRDFPLGQSSVRIAPYFSPVLGIQRVSLDTPAGEADETDGLFYVDFGASFIFKRGWYLGLGIALGDGDRVPSGDTEVRIRGGFVTGRR